MEEITFASWSEMTARESILRSQAPGGKGISGCRECVSAREGSGLNSKSEQRLEPEQKLT